MDDEADADADHLVEELGFGSDEDGEEDEHFLCEHRCAGVRTARLADESSQLVWRQWSAKHL